MGDVVGQAWWEADLKDEKLKAKLRELDGLLRRHGAESEQQLNRGWSAALDNAGRSLENVGKRVTATGDAMTRNLTLPIVGAGLAVGKLALDFDTTLRQTVGLAGVAADSIGGIRSEILKMAGEVGKGPQELAEAFYFVASAGFEADEAMTVLKVSAKAAASGLGETQTIAQVLGGVINAYGKENMTAARAADILTEAVAQGTAEASGFASVIGNVVPGAAALGVSFDQVTAAMAGMTLSGVGVEEAATSLINIFSSLQKPTAQAEEALEGLGLSSAELRKQLREQGLLATLRTLEERFAGNETASAAVFGNIRALRGVTALLGLDTKQLNDVFAEVEDSLGRQEEAYKATEGPQRDLARSMAELQATAIELGEDVLPVAVDILKQLAGGAKELARWWGTLDDDTKKMVVQLALLIAVAGPVLSIVGKLTTGLGGLLKVIAFLGGPATLAKVATVGVAFRAMLGPIGLVLAAAEALKFGLNELTDGGLDMEQAFFTAAQGTGDLKGALDEAIAAAERADIPFDEFRESVVRTMQETGATWDEAVRRVEHGTGVISSALAKSGEDWESYQNQIAGSTEEAVDAAALEAAGLPPEIASILSGGADQVGTGADAMTDEIAEAAAQARKDAVAEMAQMLDNLTSLFDNEEDLVDAWKALIDRMDDPYTEGERKADIFSKTTIANIRNAIKTGDPAIVADTQILVNNMLTQFDAMEPGALARGEAVPPALRSGMDSEMSALITWIEQNVTHEALDAMSLEEAEELGLGGIWSYAQGMKRNERLAWLSANAIRVTAKERLEFDASSGGASVVSSWLWGMTNAYWANRRLTIDAIANDAGNVFGRSLPRSGPLKGGVGSGGYSIGESWIGGIVASISAGRSSIEAAVGSVGAAMTFATAAGDPLAFAGAAAATGEASVGSSVAAALGSAGNVAPVHIEKHTHVHPVGPVPVETDDDLRRLIERTDWIGEDGAWTNG